MLENPSTSLREHVKLSQPRTQAPHTNNQVHSVWFDTRKFQLISQKEDISERLAHSSFTGILLYPDSVSMYQHLPPSLQRVFVAENQDDLQQLSSQYLEHAIVASSQQSILEQALTLEHQTCYRAYVDDADSLHSAIGIGKSHAYLAIHFRDPTNIPLELVIASLQSAGTVLIKEINATEDVDDAIVSLGVMEYGADGVMYTPHSHRLLDRFHNLISTRSQHHTNLETAKIVRTVPVGLGYRSCIDIATLFEEDQGLLVGSTSQGGILCCPEVFHLPYMELRPFRVNAGAVHSYVYNHNNHTNYMTELKAGSDVMIVRADGTSSHGTVGRMKTEMRPLRLIEAEFESGELINTIMQDDWHVRIFSEDVKPLNITELRPGDRILAHKADPGRHVGIKIQESIFEH